MKDFSTIDQEILNKIKIYCIENKHEESCGFIYKTESNILKIYKCKNIASDSKKYFLINDEDYERCCFKGDIICCFHSHLKNFTFSYEDIKESFKNQIPYLLYNLKEDNFYYFDPDKYKRYEKYLDLDFEFGKNDCFSLCLDFYKNELGIELYDPTPDRNKIYKPPHNNVICDRLIFKKWLDDSNLTPLDIKDQSEFKLYDLLIFDGWGRDEPTHFAIYLENKMILHHTFNGKSKMEAMRTAYKKYYKFLLRHKKYA